MISVEEASKIVNEHSIDFGTEEILLENSIGRVLREDIRADRDFPPYDRIAMDGIAIRHDAYIKGEQEFYIAGIAAAGDEKKSMSEKGKCLEVMTGAIMPYGLDTVIPYEEIEIKDGKAIILSNKVIYRQNIHFRGLDRRKGNIIIQSRKKISSAEVGLCASVGKSKIKVSRLPKTMIISTGDELVDIDQEPKAHQIRRSNVYRIQTLLKNYNINVETSHLQDDYDSIIKALKTFLTEFEVIILSGGVSKGKFDFIPKALEDLGVTKHFHKVAQRPGKPFWFGSYNDKTTVFALPGNPVSSFICIQKYFIDWLNKSIKAESNEGPFARLASNVQFKADLTYFLEVKLSYSIKGEIIAEPLKGNGSGDLANLVDADAFIVLPRGKEMFKKGEAFPILTYR